MPLDNAGTASDASNVATAERSLHASLSRHDK